MKIKMLARTLCVTMLAVACGGWVNPIQSNINQESKQIPPPVETNIVEEVAQPTTNVTQQLVEPILETLVTTNVIEQTALITTNATEQTTPATTVSQSKKIRMVTEATFPPYEYREGKRIVGIDPDIVREIAKRKGYELEIVDMKFDSILAAVQSGKADIAAAGITITEERKKSVYFSNPYISTGLAVVVPKDSKIKSIEDLHNISGLRIGVQQGTTSDSYVKENICEPERFDSNAIICQAIMSGKLDAGIIDFVPAEHFVKQNNGELILLPGILNSEEYAFAISKERPDLVAVFNEVLEDMQEEGLIKHIVNKHVEKLNEQTEETVEITGFWEKLKDDFKTNFVDDDRYMYLVDGFCITLIVSAGAVILGVLIGFLVAVIRSAADQTGKLKIANAICKLYLTVIRGTPVVVQLLIIYFVIFGSVDVSKVLIAIIAFGLNSGAYVAEIIRSGIMSIDKGQLEAGRSLGLSYPRTMVRIILPQAFKNVLPALGNEFIVLLKETSISGYIALEDLTKGGDIIRGQTYNAFVPLMAVAIIYLIVVIFLSKLLALLEKRLKKNE